MSSLVFSCCTIPEIAVLERCTTSIQFNKCRCHLYDFNKFKRVGDAYDMELSYCDDITGFHAEDWLQEITPKGKALRRWIRQNCRGKK